MSTTFLQKSPIYQDLAHRLEADTFPLIQVILGPRQVGKTTTLRRFLEEKLPDAFIYASADNPTPSSREWILSQWEKARVLATQSKAHSTRIVLAIDEIQKIHQWSEAVKACFDEDRYRKTRITPVLLGSSALLMNRGLSESLAGRFEVIRFPHWSFSECAQAFGASLEDYLFFGGYPAGYAFRQDPERWRAFILDSMIDTTINRDVLQLSPIEKPALFRQTFAMACQYPAQIVAYQKFVGQLADAGNTTTIAHYLDLLSKAFLIAPLPKWSERPVRQRASSPKLILLNNALVSAIDGRRPNEAFSDPEYQGRITENAVAAHFINAGLDVFYWRDRDLEVDLIVKYRGRLYAAEITFGGKSANSKGLSALTRRNPAFLPVKIGGAESDISIAEILSIDPKKFLTKL